MLTGSLETFASTEVLRLVAGTRKTGSLVVRGRGPLSTTISVDVRVRDGLIVEATGGSPLASDTLTALADLLRISDGDFTFDADGSVPASADALDVEDAIAEAETIMAEWQVLERVVPSLDAAVSLVATVDAPVTLTADQWSSISAIGSGCTARTLGQITGTGPLGVCRTLRDLVELGVVRVLATDSETTGRHQRDEFRADDDHQDADHADADRAFDPMAVPTPPPAPAVAETAGDDTAAAAVAVDLPLGPDAADLAPPPPAPPAPPVEPRYQHFSPRAAAAVAATEPPPAGAARGAGDEVVSRNVLLKFLSSARQTA